MGAYLDQSLPFSGTLPLSRHCSELGAEHAQPKACRQTRRYLDLLYRRGETGLTDFEASVLLGLMRSTINARRVPLTKGDDPWITTVETRPGPTGVRNAVWLLTEVGQKAVADMNAADRAAGYKEARPREGLRTK